MDRIIIENLEVFSKHGVLKEERVLGQKFLLSMELFCDISAAGMEDDLEKTIDYGRVCNFINSFMTENMYYLIEAAAEKLCRALLTEFAPALSGIRLTLKKPWAPVGLPLETVGVTIERHWHTAYISAGSNMGDRERYLKNALLAFEDSRVCRMGAVSRIIETKPYGVTDQGDFLNMAFELKTVLTPAELLRLCADTEAKNGRVREKRWGERTLDLDILFYDDLIIRSTDPDLIIPHYDMHRRGFVLEPMNEIAPFKVHPVLKKTVSELYGQL